jgi:hypothetical protein
VDNAQFSFDPPGSLFQGYAQVIAQVGSSFAGRPSCTTFSSKENVEDVPELAESLETAEGFSEVKTFKSGPAGAAARASKIVVLGAFIWIREHLVGIVYFFEFFSCAGFFVYIRMVLAGQLAVGSFYLIGRSGF